MIRAKPETRLPGACTRKIDTRPTGYEPIVSEGGLSRFTTTSATWDSAWPLKPDGAFEGGNAAKDRYGAAGMAGRERPNGNVSWM